ncbi:hypothetical protein MY8738_003895 [Beauveria namnaoensis]
MTETFTFFGRRYKAPGDGCPGGARDQARTQDEVDQRASGTCGCTKAPTVPKSDPLTMAFYLDFGVQAWSARSDGVVDLK